MANTTLTPVPRKYRDCKRCRGTGTWIAGQRGGVCFGCGGQGRNEVITKARALELKRNHVAEATGILARNEASLATKLAANAPDWQVGPVRGWVERDRKLLAKLAAELAQMEAV